MNIEPTAEQLVIIHRIANLRQGRTLIVSGAAGTGKSTILMAAINEKREDTGSTYALAPTGRAAARLKSLGVHATTIHKLLYAPKDRGFFNDPEWELTTEDLNQGDRIIVDESSMITPRIANDLCGLVQFKDCCLVLVGDQFQLPPVLSFAEERTYPKGFSAMDGDGFRNVEKVELKHVFRQALDSPILAAATALRERKNAAPAAGQSAYAVKDCNVALIVDDIVRSIAKGEESIAIAWTNAARHQVNRMVRAKVGLNGTLCAGEPLMVLFNQHTLGIMNGEQAHVVSVNESSRTVVGTHPIRVTVMDAIVEFAGQEIEVSLAMDFFAGQTKILPADIYKREGGIETHIRRKMLVADFGYCSTAHKAQGNEWSKVYVFVEPKLEHKTDWRRWLYTAMTRAKDSLTVYAPNNGLIANALR